MNRDITKGARFSFYLMLFLMGSVFWIATKTGHFYMSEAVYGRAVDYPAVMWAAAMLFPAAMYIGALFINGKRWWTAPTRIAIGVGMVAYFGAFVVSAISASGGDLMVIASGVMGLKAGLLSIFDMMDMHDRKARLHE